MHQIGRPVVYRTAVVGAGPAGLACVGNLLDKLKISGNDRILWIDPHFKAGRLEKYPEVPSNTKVCLFTRFAEACDSFACEESQIYRKLLKDFDQQRGCKLKWASELCKELTVEIKGKIDTFQGEVESIEHENCGNETYWNIKIKGKDCFKSKLIFLATGSKPKDAPPQAEGQIIHLDDALNPQILETKFGETETVAVHGSSHSAMLVLKNLLDSPKPPNKIINFYRHEPKFAHFPDPLNCPDQILHDNTGLKGETAEWARSWVHLTAEGLGIKFNNKFIRIKIGSGQYCDDLKAAKSCDNREIDESCNDIKIDKRVFAIGYQRNSLPIIIYAHSPIDPSKIDYTATGQLKTTEIPVIDGLFGFGVAFPERVRDLDGSGEVAVGLWKFMRHIKKSIELIEP